MDSKAIIIFKALSSFVKGIHIDPSRDEWDQEIEYLRQQVQERTRQFAVYISYFEGKSQPDGFINWLNTEERVFDYNDVPKNKSVKIIAIKLKKGALVWWEQLRARHDITRKPKINTRKKMKKILKEKYLPKNYLQSLYQEMHVLRQEDRSVDEYKEEFHLLTAHNVVFLQYWTLDEAYHLAKRFEIQDKRPSNRWGTGITKKGLFQDSTDPKGVSVATSSATSVQGSGIQKAFFKGDSIYDEPVDEEDPEVTYNLSTDCKDSVSVHSHCILTTYLCVIDPTIGIISTQKKKKKVSILEI
ncbi:hypothetical protein AMTRI_Chr05g71070 [Amborella trichopoda]